MNYAEHVDQLRKMIDSLTAHKDSLAPGNHTANEWNALDSAVHFLNVAVGELEDASRHTLVKKEQP